MTRERGSGAQTGRTVTNTRDRSGNLIEIEWLADNASHQILLPRRRLSGRAIPGYQHDGKVRAILPNSTCSFPAIHFRHSQIGEYQIKIVSRHLLQSLAPTFGCYDFV